MNKLLDNNDELLFNYLNISYRLSNLIKVIACKNIKYYNKYIDLVLKLITERCNILEINNIKTQYIVIEEELSYKTLQEFHNNILSLMTSKSREVQIGYNLVLGLKQKIKQ
jgi:hypothetical protein